jgi:HemY protein
LLTDSLNAQWDSELVTQYGECHNDDNIAQIEQAERWLKQHTDDAGLLLALGKLCMHQKLWGKAQSYLDASLSLQNSRGAYVALGKLAEKLGNQEQALTYFQKSMQAENKL